MKKSFLLIGLITFLYSCSGDFPINPFNNEGEKMHTLVYVDLSRSQDTGSVNRATDKIVELYKNLPDDYNNTFILRAIDNDLSEPLLEIDLETFDDIREYQIKQRDSLKALNSKLIKEKINFYYTKVVPTSEKSLESCICNSLENAHTNLSGIDSLTTIRLFVFSDMFEECGKNSSNIRQDLYFCEKKGKQKTIEALKADIEAYYKPAFLISEYVKPENLYFIITESDLYNERPRCLNVSEVKQLWRELFIKMGYKAEEISGQDGITYSTQLPDRVLNK